jgi:hypothetical protein
MMTRPDDSRDAAVMTLNEIQQRYDKIQRCWPAARSRGELRDNIDALDELLEAIEDKQSRWPTGDLWDKVNELQGTLRLELAGRHAHPSRTALNATADR